MFQWNGCDSGVKAGVFFVVLMTHTVWEDVQWEIQTYKTPEMACLQNVIVKKLDSK